MISKSLPFRLIQAADLPTDDEKTHGRPKHYKQYTPEDAANARDSALNDTQSASAYSVPRTTINHQRNHPHQDDDHRRYLSEREENALAVWIAVMAKYGFPATPNCVKQKAVQIMAKNNKKPHGNMDKWWEGFERRHEKTLHMASVTVRSAKQAAALSPDVLNHYFDLLQHLVDKYGLTAERIFNLDETGVEKLGGRAKVIVPKEMKQPKAIINILSEHITILTCVNAHGDVFPPLFILKGKYNSKTRTYILHGAPEKSWVAFTRKRNRIACFLSLSLQPRPSLHVQPSGPGLCVLCMSSSAAPTPPSS